MRVMELDHRSRIENSSPEPCRVRTLAAVAVLELGGPAGKLFTASTSIEE